jgi:hypothetical protein
MGQATSVNVYTSLPGQVVIHNTRGGRVLYIYIFSLVYVLGKYEKDSWFQLRPVVTCTAAVLTTALAVIFKNSIWYFNMPYQ